MSTTLEALDSVTSSRQPKFRCQYIFETRWGKPNHTWTALGAQGALHLHITDNGEEHAQKYGDRYIGGIEVHYRTPPEYMADDPPSQDECWLLKCPCWHDGSSLQASEIWIPRWLSDPDDHVSMFEYLTRDAVGRFG